MKAHVSQKKKDEVNLINKLLKEYKTIGLIDLTGLPSPQLQTIRKKLKKSLLLRTTKKRLIKIILKNNKIDQLIPYLEKCMPALLFTNEDPFKLANQINKSKSSAPAKPGQTSPKDLYAKAGPTPFSPGPIIGELGAQGIKAGIEGGKVVIKQDSLVVREGQIITSKQAELLAKLGIEPMEVGLNIVAIYDNGQIIPCEILLVSEEQYISDLKLAYTNSFNLAIKIGHVTTDTIKHLIKKAHSEALALSKSQDILTEDSVKQKLAVANKQMEILKEQIPEDTSRYSEEASEKAQEILKEIQDKKLAEQEKEQEKPKEDATGYSEEASEKAQEVLKQEQDKKLEKKVPTAFKLKEKKGKPKVNKVPSAHDLKQKQDGGK